MQGTTAAKLLHEEDPHAGAGAPPAGGAGGYGVPPPYAVPVAAPYMPGFGGAHYAPQPPAYVSYPGYPPAQPYAIPVPLPQPTEGGGAPGGDPSAHHPGWGAPALRPLPPGADGGGDSGGDAGHHRAGEEDPVRSARRRARRVPPCCFPALLALNLLHWGTLALAIAFTARARELVGPLCDPNACGFMGCDFMSAKCTNRNDVLTVGLVDDGMGSFSCCAAKADVALVNGARPAWATGIAACVVGCLAALLGPLVAGCSCCGHRSEAHGGGGRGGARLRPASMRLPVVGAAYTLKWYRRGWVDPATGALALDGDGAAAAEACDGCGGPNDPAARSAARHRVLATLSRAMLLDSFLRDVLLLAAGAVWVWHAQPGLAGSSLAPGGLGGAGVRTQGALMVSGPLAFGSWLFVAACASMAATLGLRSRAVLRDEDDSD